MSTVTLGGNPIDVAGRFPQAGDAAPAFKLTGADLADVGLDAFAGKRTPFSIATSPPLGSKSPPRIFIKVDLPEPLAPIRP